MNKSFLRKKKFFKIKLIVFCICCLICLKNKKNFRLFKYTNK